NWGQAIVLSYFQTINPYNFGVTPSARIRFTDFDSMSGSGRHIILLPEPSPPEWTLTSLIIEDCSFHSGSGDAFILRGRTNSTFSLNNNLFERVPVLFEGDINDPQGDKAAYMNVYNNLLRNVNLSTCDFMTNNWVFKDNVFDSSVIS